MRYLDLLPELPARTADPEWEDPGFWPGDIPRARHLRNLLSALSAEVASTSPAGLGKWLSLGTVVDAPADRLFDCGFAYVEGRAEREELLRAAREVRHSWWKAAALFKQAQRETQPMERAA